MAQINFGTSLPKAVKEEALLNPEELEAKRDFEHVNSLEQQKSCLNCMAYVQCSIWRQMLFHNKGNTIEGVVTMDMVNPMELAKICSGFVNKKSVIIQ